MTVRLFLAGACAHPFGAGGAVRAEAQLLLSLLVALPEQPVVAARGLEALFAQRGERELAETVRRWEVEREPGR